MEKGLRPGNNSFAGFDEDFVTVNPYLGTDGVKPFVDVCKEEKKGLFILVKTSNPSSGEFQDRLIDGRPLYELVGEQVAKWGEDCMGDDYSYVGAVVGATYPEQGKVLRKIMPMFHMHSCGLYHKRSLRPAGRRSHPAASFCRMYEIPITLTITSELFFRYAAVFR